MSMIGLVEESGVVYPTEIINTTIIMTFKSSKAAEKNKFPICSSWEERNQTVPRMCKQCYKTRLR